MVLGLCGIWKVYVVLGRVLFSFFGVIGCLGCSRSFLEGGVRFFWKLDSFMVKVSGDVLGDIWVWKELVLLVCSSLLDVTGSGILVEEEVR